MPEIERLDVSAYTVPTERPEADGTLTWDATTIVVAEPVADGVTGLGYTYATAACGRLISDVLTERVIGKDAMDTGGCWLEMVRAIRNLGRPGVCSMAIAAVDTALWDLKAKLLGVPLVSLLGQAHDSVIAYGSGGFTTLADDELRAQIDHWIADLGLRHVKIKIGEDRGRRYRNDIRRTELVRSRIGDDRELFVDANGAYSTKGAVRVSRAFDELGVSWFEEPVSSDHLDSLALVRSATAIDVAAGEYGYDLFYFERMCSAGAVDCLQADITRCAGLSEWLRVAALADAHGLEISGHCAPSLHLHPACAIANIRHLEFFSDHERLEKMMFEGAAEPRGGLLCPDLNRSGFGLELRRSDINAYRVL